MLLKEIKKAEFMTKENQELQDKINTINVFYK